MWNRKRIAENVLTEEVSNKKSAVGKEAEGKALVFDMFFSAPIWYQPLDQAY
jgi:hypothetical protein